MNKLAIALLANLAVHLTFILQSATLFLAFLFCPPSDLKQQGLHYRASEAINSSLNVYALS